jgi:hypothetical protein
MSGRDPAEELADEIQKDLEGAAETVQDLAEGFCDTIDDLLGVHK